MLVRGGGSQVTVVRIPVTPEQVLLRVGMAKVSKNVENLRFFKGLRFRTAELSTASHVISRLGTRATGRNSLLLCNADYKRQSMQ